MSRIIQLEIPDTLFKAIERQAAAQNTDPASLAAVALQQHFQWLGEPTVTAGKDGGFESLFGAADLGHPTGLDNDKIDADLVNDYSHGLTG